MSGSPKYDGALRDIQSPTGLHYRIHETPEDLAVLTPRVAQEPEIWIDTETADWNTKSPRLSLVQLRLGDGSLAVLSTEMAAGVNQKGSAPSRLHGEPVLRPESRDGSVEQGAICGHQHRVRLERAARDQEVEVALRPSACLERRAHRAVAFDQGVAQV